MVANGVTIEKTPQLPELIWQIDELLEEHIVALVTLSPRDEFGVMLPGRNPELKAAVLNALCNIDWDELRQRLCGDTPK